MTAGQWEEARQIIALATGRETETVIAFTTAAVEEYRAQHGRPAMFELVCELAEGATYWVSANGSRASTFAPRDPSDELVLPFLNAAISGDRHVAAETFWRLDQAAEQELIHHLLLVLNLAHQVAHDAWGGCRFGPTAPRLN
jgi:hypothetical protein